MNLGQITVGTPGRFAAWLSVVTTAQCFMPHSLADTLDENGE